MKPTHCIANRALLLSLVLVSGGVIAAESLQGQVLGAGAPIANSTVTLWAATSGPPAQLGQARTGADGRFSLNATIEGAKDASLYLVAKGGKSAADKTTGDNSAIALMAGGLLPTTAVTINELTTVASVWTGAQFLKGDTFSGHALGLKIAAGNVPNLVDLATGGLGPVIQDPLNSTQTTDLSIFGTLGDLLAACTTRVRSDACTKLFAGFHASRRGNADRHIDCGGGYCTTSLEQARDIVCTPERLLSCPARTGFARRTVPTVPLVCSEYLDHRTALRRRWTRRSWRHRH